ncbi:MAG: MotA/TolQ/ExbB proton channel family protein [Gammaproteobacteria bacterium]|uniref:MotA/TolQ/ExbB proton channel family protein n=1 Tax=Candidatus Thiopontia autotrophica TaxID=2841688 RepID=A0A8J6TVQ7_9GAMM|nr:MotA/TolQ/ExbB proton channel family protein [Candidatus Thiopontia autotrophica]MBL6969208.1 MotA/TolQ/ExbB proton channel family protein [Gammaproteobacteria bacterium]
MEVSPVQGIFSVVTDNIFTLIYLLAIVEIGIIALIASSLKRHSLRLHDVSSNLLKGFADAPDQDSLQKSHEKIDAALHYLSNKILLDKSAAAIIKENVSRLSERNLYNRYYLIESASSVMSTMVQIFPLLGILGTILAIAGTAFGDGGIDASRLTSAFVLAMDTTILGIGFSVIFMMVESFIAPKVERMINESIDFKNIITRVHLG